MYVLCFVNDDDNVETFYIINLSRRGEYGLLVAFNDTCIYLYSKIIITTRVITLCAFIYLLKNIHKLLYDFLGVLF